ncbi:aldose 1-epimerase [Erythrobacter insulae]|uniref:Aldose 1-epimerase n=1 Tax=Erythrobacter insulae TaxID=2584124 RepID=A0A547PD65_9SPHN|nr:aldose 1-epimerase [Erythrobacter insulae]TRD12081.1 aldose 1-epimerase [Erythrobacter insulae]
MLELNSGDYHVVIDPERGGSLAAFEWAGHAILRASMPGAMSNTACFPIVPFSNRIGAGEFELAGSTFKLAPNAPSIDDNNPIHGYGWLSAWDVISADAARVVIEHTHDGSAWPWRYRARQYISLAENGLFLQLEVTNVDKTVMPAGLGFHPYFHRGDKTSYHGLHKGEWSVDEGCLPTRLIELSEPADWWKGAPVGSRTVDTVYTGRKGPLTLIWPDLCAKATIKPSENLPFTVVYTPRGLDFFCIEPVSHETDAINTKPCGMTMLAPGETMQAWIHIEIEAAD